MFKTIKIQNKWCTKNYSAKPQSKMAALNVYNGNLQRIMTLFLSNEQTIIVICFSGTRAFNMRCYLTGFSN